MLALSMTSVCSPRSKPISTSTSTKGAKTGGGALRSTAPEGVTVKDSKPEQGSVPVAVRLPLPSQSADISAVVAASQGGTLRVHVEAEPPHLDPLLDAHQVIDQVVTGLVYDTLIECRDGGYQPALAQSWEASADGSRLTFRLRDGVRWHDGRPFNPSDVQASLEPLIRSNAPLPLVRALLADVAAVEIAPDRLVRLRLHRPSDLVLRAMCEIPILPEHFLRAGKTAIASLGRQPVGTGPFRFEVWERGKRIRLARNREGWRRAPALDGIVFEIDPDGARALGRLRRGDIDVMPRLPDAYYPDQVEPAALQDTLQFHRLEPDRYSFLVLNHRRELLASLPVRKALALLWERGKLAGVSSRPPAPAVALAPASAPGLARPIGAPTFGDVPPEPFDRQAAIRLLDSAGYLDVNGDGVRDRNGAAIGLTVLLPAGSRALAQELKAYAQELRRAGLLLEIQAVDGAKLLARLAEGNFDLAPLMWEGRADDDPRPLFGSRGEFNFGGYKSERLDQLLDALRAAAGPAARRPQLQRIAEVIAAEVPVVFLYRHDVPALSSKRVHGLAAVGDKLELRGVWLSQ